MQPPFEDGHFHSPVVNLDEARKYGHREVNLSSMPALTLARTRMLQFWRDNCDTIRNTPFGPAPGSGTRYYYGNDVFPIGDAALYRAMIFAHKPKRIIEIGSGFSTAVALDAADEFSLDIELHCIEPDPARLQQLLNPEPPTDREDPTARSLDVMAT